jgi:uncharacterized Zn-binding protein involved in type VI secretion
MAGVARVGDRVKGVCSCHEDPKTTTGVIIRGADSVYANSNSVARIGDLVRADCGHTGKIVGGSTKCFAESGSVARIGDKVAGCFTGTIVKGSDNVNSG